MNSCALLHSYHSVQTFSWKLSLPYLSALLHLYISTLFFALFAQTRILVSSVFRGWAGGPYICQAFFYTLILEDVPLVEFMDLVFTHMLGESYHRRLRSLFVRRISTYCWFCSFKSKLKTHLFSSSYWFVVFFVLILLTHHHQCIALCVCVRVCVRAGVRARPERGGGREGEGRKE